ncbi:MAG: phosphate signaling complex protein PhoU [Pseudomonadota bacterium]
MRDKDVIISQLQTEIDRIKEDILKMGGLVEEALEDATKALADRDEVLAKSVIQKDRRVNELENYIDAFCIRVIATKQPVAADLRLLTACLRICSSLERSGDQAVNLSQRTLALCELAPMETVLPSLLQMAELGKEMTRKALDAFVRRDVALAREVCCQDDEMDDLNRQVLEEMLGWMMDEKRLVRRGVELILASRHLERVGDQATNMAEEVVFMVEGNIIRHQADEACRPAEKRA